MALTLAFVMAPGAAAAEPERRATIFYTGGVAGTLEPCGCTSDPLGDIARLTGLVRAAGDRALLVDAGNLLYRSTSIDERRAEGADLKAAFLAAELGKLRFGGSALGELDLARGPERVIPERLVANFAAPPGSPVNRAGRLQTVGGIRIGIVGLADPALGRRLGWKVEEPVAALEAEAKRLRAEGAEVIIALAALDRAAVRPVARAGAAEIIVVGKNVGAGLTRADAVGDSYIVAPADELQKVGRIDLVMRDGGARIVDAGGPEAQEIGRAELMRRRTGLDKELEAFAADASADPSFVATRKKDRDQIEGELAALSGKWAPPATGSYFINQLIPLRRALPRDTQLAAAMRVLDQKVGAANLRQASPPPPAPPERASFVGDKACAGCHKGAMAFWQKTVHARAWKTIVEGGKTGFDDCVSCHVTGFGEVGGSSLGHVVGLTNVQCETCHGPGSLHVKGEGLEEPVAIKLQTPASSCVRCHNEKHSDTFDYVAYLRDVLGPGHGAKARAALGPGPTGAKLRAAAKAKAKAAARVALGSGRARK